MITESAPLDATLLRHRLLDKDADSTIAAKLGKVLGEIHRKTHGNERIKSEFSDLSIITNLKLPIFYYPLLENDSYHTIVKELITDIQTTKESLVHGDFNPKNILIWPDGVNIIDWEQAHYGDPRAEMGSFLAHYVIKGIHNGDHLDNYLSCMDAVLAQYRDVTQEIPLCQDDTKINQHLGVYLLGRVDSVAKALYLKDPLVKNRIRALGKSILLGAAQQSESITQYIRSSIEQWRESERYEDVLTV